MRDCVLEAGSWRWNGYRWCWYRCRWSCDERRIARRAVPRCDDAYLWCPPLRAIAHRLPPCGRRDRAAIAVRAPSSTARVGRATCVPLPDVEDDLFMRDVRGDLRRPAQRAREPRRRPDRLPRLAARHLHLPNRGTRV